MIISETDFDLCAVITAVTNDFNPQFLISKNEEEILSLPKGAFDSKTDITLESAMINGVTKATGLNLSYVEQLYTFGNRYRTTEEIKGGNRQISVAYLALVEQSNITFEVQNQNAKWVDWYSLFPWEDWRQGRPEILNEFILPALNIWATKDDRNTNKKRQERILKAFGFAEHNLWSANVQTLSLERYELLYEANLIPESLRDMALKKENNKQTLSEEDTELRLGLPLMDDHRRVLATAIGRIRGKLQYRPLVFDLLPDVFALAELQQVVEAMSGVRLHTSNFRRMVEGGGLVEPTKQMQKGIRGRPSKLYRMLEDTYGHKGVGLPILSG